MQFSQHLLSVHEKIARLMVGQFIEIIRRVVSILQVHFFFHFLLLLLLELVVLLLFLEVFVDTVIIVEIEISNVITEIVEIHFLIGLIGVKEVVEMIIIELLFLQVECV